jgi:hypothetical protein
VRERGSNVVARQRTMPVHKLALDQRDRRAESTERQCADPEEYRSERQSVSRQV